jgi:hypothetical protein
MSKELVCELLNRANERVREYVDQHNLPPQNELVLHFMRVFNFMLVEANDIGEIKNIRLLRGFKDLTTNTAMWYENADFAQAIFDLDDYFMQSNKNYKNFDLLRADFGMGFPI